MSVFVSVCMLFLLPQLIKPSQSDINKDYMCVLLFNAASLLEGAGFVYHHSEGNISFVYELKSNAKTDKSFKTLIDLSCFHCYPMTSCRTGWHERLKRLKENVILENQ